MRTILSLFIAVALSPALALQVGCGGGDSTSGDPGSSQVAVVATTSQAADLARNVVSGSGEVTQILAPNADPHDYEPQPSDAEALIEADLIVRSGGDLDAWLDQVIESSGTDAPVLTLMDDLPTVDGEGEPDPHWWQDPTNAVRAVEEIRRELVAVDPAGAADFDGNAKAYTAKLEKLDRAIAGCMDEVPDSDRKLVTSHDALGYFAQRYGIEVIGAAIPALSTQAQASAGETVELVELIQEAGVRTIFPEAGVSAELEQAIADEAGANVGGELWADTLGPEDSDGATYIDAMQANAATLVEGFTDGGETCGFDHGS